MANVKADNAYRMFHGKKPKQVTRGNFHVPTHFILLGDAVEIVYKCDKLNGGGDGRKWEYTHKFKKGTKLYMDERKGKVLYISGATLKVTSAGIVN